MNLKTYGPSQPALDARYRDPNPLWTPYGQWAGMGPGREVIALVASRLMAVRFVPVVDMAVTSIAFVVTTAASVNDSVDVGILAADGTLLNSSGSTAGKVNATGAQSIAIPSTAIKAGSSYWLCISCGTIGGTAAVVTALNGANSNSNVASVLAPTIAATPTAYHTGFFKAATFPIVTTAPSGGSVTTGIAALAARVA